MQTTKSSKCIKLQQIIDMKYYIAIQRTRVQSGVTTLMPLESIGINEWSQDKWHMTLLSCVSMSWNSGYKRQRKARKSKSKK